MKKLHKMFARTICVLLAVSLMIGFAPMKAIAVSMEAPFDNRPLLFRFFTKKYWGSEAPGVTVVVYRDDVEIGRTVTELFETPFLPISRGDFSIRGGFYVGEYSARIFPADESYHFYPGRIPIYLNNYTLSVRGYHVFFVYTPCPIRDFIDTYPYESIGLKLDGTAKELEAMPIIRLARIMLPVCQVTELLGGGVRVNESGTITVYYNDRRAEIGKRDNYFHFQGLIGYHVGPFIPHYTSVEVLHYHWGWDTASPGGGGLSFRRVPYYKDGMWYVTKCFFECFFGVVVLWDEPDRNLIILQQNLAIMYDGIPLEGVPLVKGFANASVSFRVPFLEFANAIGSVQTADPFYSQITGGYYDRYRVVHQNGFTYFIRAGGSGVRDAYFTTGYQHIQLSGRYVHVSSLAANFNQRVSIGQTPK